MNFRASGTHKVIFSGNRLQTVVFEDSQSYFNEVVYENERVRTLSVDEYNRLIIGDIDGDREVSIKDVLFVCSALLNKTYNSSADVDANGKITLYDVMYVLKRTAM